MTGHASGLPSAATPRWRARLAQRLGAAARVLRAVLGAPDYERYLAHVRERHPDVAPLTREEFERERLTARARPGQRCC